MRVLKNLVVASALAFTVSGCAKKTEEVKPSVQVAPIVTQQSLIKGRWTLSSPVVVVEDQGSMKILEARADYLSDGTTTGYAEMKLIIKDLPEDMSTYSMSSDGGWEILDGKLIERTNKIKIFPKNSSNPGALEVAREIEKQASDSPKSMYDIIQLDSKTMIIKDVDTGIIMEFTKN